ncbi:DUF6318 family protein [Micrococcoides hystricis]|uniref:DUF6318 family protein n=1 Tax=Micrococcoides hystricis TaxID=1572761 RepID=A0ABV6P855_9MICC
MRRPLAALSALALSVTLAGCFQMPQQQPEPPQGGQQQPPAQPPQSPQPQPEPPSPSPSPSPDNSTPPVSALEPDLSEPTPPAGDYEEATEEHPARNVPIPTLDEEAKNQDDSGVLATVKYYVQTQDFVKQTGNAKPLSKIVTEQCKACMQYAASVNFLTYSKGNWYVGDGVSVEQVSVGPSQTDPKVKIATFEFLEPEIILVENGVARVVEKEHTYDSKMALRFDETLGHWVVLDVTAERIK